MMAGEKNLLTAYEYNHFNETSGTVGAPKVVPMTDKQSEVFAKYNNLIMYGIIRKNLPEDWMNGRGFCTSSGNCRTLPSGLTVGEASAKMADYIKGGKEALDAMIRTMYTSPVEGLHPERGSDTKYIHTRFALMDREVRGMITGFYSVVVLFLRYIEDNIDILINDGGIFFQTTPQWMKNDDYTLSYLGEQRFAKQFQAGTMQRGGVTVTFGSDSCLEPETANAFVGMFYASARGDSAACGKECLPPQSESISRMESLMAYTVNAAKQLKLDYKTGSISVGKLADFAVIDRDVINCPVQELKKIKVEQTWFCGNRGI